jgi:hypothetical protein
MAQQIQHRSRTFESKDWQYPVYFEHHITKEHTILLKCSEAYLYQKLRELIDTVIDISLLLMQERITR